MAETGLMSSLGEGVGVQTKGLRASGSHSNISPPIHFTPSKAISLPLTSHQTPSRSSCTEHTQCANRAPQPPRRSRAPRLLLPPPSLAGSLERPVLVRLDTDSEDIAFVGNFSASNNVIDTSIQAIPSADPQLAHSALTSRRSSHNWSRWRRT